MAVVLSKLGDCDIPGGHVMNLNPFLCKTGRRGVERKTLNLAQAWMHVSNAQRERCIDQRCQMKVPLTRDV